MIAVRPFLVGLVLLLPASLLAQTFQGGVRGVITNADGGVLPGTSVILVELDTEISRMFIANSQGEFAFTSVTPGIYNLSAELPGFASYTREGLQFGVATQLVQDIVLQVGDISESVTVTGETPLIERANASIASSIDKVQLEVLPTPGRNVFVMAVTTPNVVHAGDPMFVRQQDQTNSSLLSLGGGPLRGNNYTIDGVAISDMRNRAVIIPNFEGTEEMKVQINSYDSEMGRTGGAVFNTIHKSGSNEWAGSALYQSRPNVGRTKTFFQSEKAADAPYDLWGGGFGGPIVKDKVFFYFSTEGYRNVDLRSDIMTFPSIKQAGGDFSGFNRTIYNPYTGRPFPGNVIPAGYLDPVGVALAKDLASVGRAAGCSISSSAAPCNVEATARLNNKAYQWTINGNGAVTDNWSMSSTWMFYDSKEPANKYYTDIMGVTPTFDTGGATLFRRAYVLALNSTHLLADADVLTLRYGYTYFDDSVSNPSFSTTDARTLGFKGHWLDQVQLEQYPSISANGYGDGVNTHGSWSSNNIEWWSQEVSATYSKFVGAHTVKYGGQWRRMGLNAFNFDNGFRFSFDENRTSGGISGAGDSIASMVMGTPAASGGGNATISTPGEFFLDYFGGFVQDDWRLNEDLVLNLGLRFEYETGLNETENRFAVGFTRDDEYPIQVKPPATLTSPPGFPLKGGLVYPGELGFPDHQWNPEVVKLGPRAGFAYSLNEKTVLRGGFGVYWAPYAIPSGTSHSHTGTAGYTAVTFYEGGTNVSPPKGSAGGGQGSLTDPYPTGLNTPTQDRLGQITNAGGNVTFNDQFKKSPYITKWSFDYQRDVWDSIALKIGYVGSKGSRLGIGGTNNATTNINQLNPAFLALGDALNDYIQNPFFGDSAFGAFADDAVLTRGQLLRPYPQFKDVLASYVSNGRSIYNSLRVELEKRFRGNWGARVNYTYARQKDNVYESNLLVENEPDIVFVTGRHEDDFGLSRIHVPHWLNVNGLYRFPSPDSSAALILGGWSASVSALFRSGFPVVVTQSANATSAFGFSHQRPNLTGANPAGATDLSGVRHDDNPGSISGLLNATAYSAADAYTIGNAPHTTGEARTPRLVNWDVSFDKTTLLGGGVNLVFRFEFINIFNGVNWRGPGSVLGSANFGRIGGTRGFPRTMQFMTKLTF